MPDPTPNPDPAPTAPTPKPAPSRRSRSAVNKQHLDELQRAWEIVNAALKPEYASRLAKRDIKNAELTALMNQIQAARNQVGNAAGKTTAKEGVTASETELKDALVKLLKNVQKAVKQKATRTGDSTLLKKYGVGSNFYSSRALLEQTANNFQAGLATDKLPGIGPDDIKALRQALEAYAKVQTDQTSAQSGATTERANLETAVADIARRRREIQLAADAVWPPENKANAGIRKEFFLPPSKAFKG